LAFYHAGLSFSVFPSVLAFNSRELLLMALSQSPNLFQESFIRPFENFFAPAVIKKPMGLKLQRLFRDLLKGVQVFAFTAIFPPLLKLYSACWRCRFEVHPETQKLLEAGKPVIYAIWHAKIYTIVIGLPKANTALLVSQSTDGEMITNVLRGLGYQHFVRGSSKRGGALAMRAMFREVTEQGHSVMFTLDGPKGPRYKMKPGIIALAEQTGAPIVQVVSSCQYFWFRLMKNWDLLEFPGFFSPMAIALSEPYWVNMPSELVGSAQETDKEAIAKTVADQKAFLASERERLEAVFQDNSRQLDLKVHGKSLVVL
jgi:lysophospholipid acyltransferase (LPLAT)-like uncharacterized protein